MSAQDGLALTLAHLAVFVPPLLLIEGFFSGAEIALLSADKLHLKKQVRQGAFGAQLALDLANHPERVLSTTLLMTSLCVVGVSSLVALYFIGVGGNHSELYGVLATSPLVVVFGELIPKTLYQRYANRVARWVSYPLAWTYLLFFPLTRTLSSYTARVSRMIGPIEELLTGKRRTTRDDLRHLLSYTRRESEIKSSERQMLKRIFDFKDTEAKHALIPLVRVEAIEEDATVQEALARFDGHRHSRMPVYSGRVDNIVGVIECLDLFAATDLNHPIKNYVSPAHYVAETQALADLLAEMSQDDNEMTVVVDEHGGAVGILTFEDIVEEITGEISDEFDNESMPYKTIRDGAWIVQARMEIAQINEFLKIALPHGEYETLSGFLLQQFGRIPTTKDELFFNTSEGSFKFTIQKATQRHIETVLVEKISG